MAIFADSETANGVKARLAASTGLWLGADFDGLFTETLDPDRALLNLERWLLATGNPATHLISLQRLPQLAKPILLLLGSGQSVADALFQNPELASMAVDPAEIARLPSAQNLLEEGRNLLLSCSSSAHRKDRLRFLKQRGTLQIVLHDLLGLSAPETVWRSISDLAEVLIELSAQVTWSEVTSSQEPCPVLVVAFGKLSGRELNYSSDVDLVLVAQDGVDERRLGRFGEMLTRTVSERMGRGHLYRVDLRLRPYGRSGPLVPSMLAVEKYYDQYAEAWEVQALLRSRPIAGPAELRSAWEHLRERVVFRKQVSEFFLDEIVRNRELIEEHGDPDDLKRGPGGIRDIEFLVQIRQLVHGFAWPEVRSHSTLGALRALIAMGRLDSDIGISLANAYTFFRQLEHRIQLLDDQQTHRLPRSELARRQVANLMGFEDVLMLEGELSLYRDQVRRLYRREVLRDAVEPSAREQVTRRVGPDAGVVASWMDPLEGADRYYEALLENRDSLRRVQSIVASMPALLPWFRNDHALSESVLSGEIEEPSETDPWTALPPDAAPTLIARTLRAVIARDLVRWMLDPTQDLNLVPHYDAVLGRILDQWYARFDVVALGSYGTGELGLESDLDLLLLVSDSDRLPEAEVQAQQLLAWTDSLRRHGAPLSIDLRLRPEGGKGLLVRSYAGFQAYELESMEMWERFALGNARGVHGSFEAHRLAIRAAYSLPVNPPRLRELVAMKKRIESERVPAQHIKRQVKLGRGGLNDIEWFVRLHELRYPTATFAGLSHRIPERLTRIAQARLIHSLELETLIQAHRHLTEVRLRLDLLGMRHDTVPENPDKLEILSKAMGFDTGNEFLATHESLRESVRGLFVESLERLRA